MELSASAGLILDDWQQDALIDSLGEKRDGSWSSFECGFIVPRQNGKGAIVEARELAGLFLFGEELLIHSAHEFKTAQEAFRRVLYWIENHDDFRRRVFKVSHSKGDEGVELKTGQRLRFVARTAGSGRGFTGNWNGMDEAYALQLSEMDALLPTMSAVRNPQVYYTSTPPKDPAAFLVELRSRALNPTPGDEDLMYQEWSPPDDFSPTPKDLEPTAADINMIRLTNPAIDIRISVGFALKERRALSDEGYARERLGAWPPSAKGQWLVISEVDYNAAVDPKSEPGVGQPISISAAVQWPDRLFGSIAIASHRSDGLKHVELTYYEPGTAGMVDKIMEMIVRWHPCTVVIDAVGPAGSLVADVKKELETRRLDSELLLIPTSRDASAAFGMFYDGISGVDRAGRNIRLRDQAIVRTAVAGARRRPLGSSWVWASMNESVDISPVVAMTNALYGLAARAPVVAPFAPLVSWR